MLPLEMKKALVYGATPFLQELLSAKEDEWKHPLSERWELIVYDSLRQIDKRSDASLLQYLRECPCLDGDSALHDDWVGFLGQTRLSEESLYDPRQSKLASWIRQYIMMRSDIMVAELDANALGACDVYMASVFGVPIIGITQSFSLPPVLHSAIQVQIKPHRETMIAVLYGLLDVPYRRG